MSAKMDANWSWSRTIHLKHTVLQYWARPNSASFQLPYSRLSKLVPVYEFPCSFLRYILFPKINNYHFPHTIFYIFSFCCNSLLCLQTVITQMNFSVYIYIQSMKIYNSLKDLDLMQNSWQIKAYFSILTFLHNSIWLLVEDCSEVIFFFFLNICLAQYFLFKKKLLPHVLQFFCNFNVHVCPLTALSICFRGKIEIRMDSLWHIRFYLLWLSSLLSHLVYEL